MIEAVTRPEGHSFRGRWKPFWVAFPIIFAMMMAWSLASPLMSSPDEPAHVIRAAAVARGDLTGKLSTKEPGTSEVTAPRYIADSMNLTCYRGNTTVSASCQKQVTDHPNQLVTAYTTATLNTPVFYLMTGLPTLFLEGHKTFYAMRAIVALVCAFLLAMVVMAVCQLSRHRWTLLATAVALTPMVFFLSGSVNPNAVEACASAATLALLALIFRTESAGRILWERIGLLVVSVFLLVNTRSLSLFWLLFICIAALIIARFDILKPVFARPVAWVGTAVMGVVVIAALWWFLIPKGLTQAFKAVGVGDSWPTAFVTSLDRTFDLGFGWIGVFGWLDTPAPGLTLIIWVSAIAAILIPALLFSSWRFRTALIITATTLILLPAIIAASLAADWGYVWQGRYSLALFVCLILLTGIALDEHCEFTWSPVLAPLVTTSIVLLAVGHLASFAWALKRYVIGLRWDTTWFHMLFHTGWQPPLGWVTLMVGYALILAVGALVVRKALRGNAPRLRASVRTQTSSTPTG